MAHSKFDSRKVRLQAILLLGLSIVLFCLGIFLPTYTVNPSTGSFWVDAVIAGSTGQDFTAQSKSIYGTIADLFSKKGVLSKALGMILAAFSIGFPGLKYVCLTAILFLRHEWAFAKTFLQWGYFSMVEVFVVAVLAASLIPFLTIRPEIGLVPFFCSVVTCYFCHKAVSKAILSSTEGASHDAS